MNLGTWRIDDLLTFPCNTHTPATGAATDADSVPAYRVYEDETGTPILTGSMAKLDDAGTTGFYSEQITLSAANGFEVGKSYTVHVSATVGGVTGTTSHTFQVEAAPATAAAVAALNNLSSAQAQAAAAAALTAYGASTYAGGDTSGTTTLLSRITALLQTKAEADTAHGLLATAANLATVITATTAAAIRAALGLGSANLDTQLGDLPTAAENADAIWDELLSGHTTAGTAGHYLADAGAAADPMMNDPADYTSGQLGYLIGRLAGGRITVRGTVTPSGDMDEIVGGADYSASDGYSFDWTDADSELAWPALTSATVTWVGRSPDGQETTLAMTVVTPTGDKVVRLALTAAQTAALVAVQTGLWTFTVWATLTSGRVRPLAKGTVPVVELVGP